MKLFLTRIFAVAHGPAVSFRTVLSVVFVFVSLPGAAVRMTEPWPEAEVRCDGIVEKLERSGGCITDEQERWVGMLYDLSRRNPGMKPVLWRALYWDAVNKHDRKEYGEAMRLIREAERMVDRRRYHYDYMRIKRSRVIFEMASGKNLYGLYTAQYDDLKYFTRVADYKSMGSCHLVMSKIFLDINEPSQALRECMEARRLFMQSNTPALIASSEINMALCHIEQGDYGKGLSLLKRLEKGTVAARDTLFHLIVLLNMSYSYSQMGIMRPEVYRGMEKLLRHGENGYFRQLCNINIGSWHYRCRQYDKAIALFSSALRYAEEHGISEWLVKCYRGLGDCYMAKHDDKKAAALYSLYALAADSLQSDNVKVRIMREEEAERIRNFNGVMYEERERARLRLMAIMAISAVSLLVIGGICLFYWYKNKQSAIQLMREKIENERRRLMLDIQNRKIAATAIEMEEKRNALKSIRCMVDDAKDKSRIDSDTARKIKTQVRIHTDADVGWETFRETFENVYPQFFSKMKARHPLLTEYDIRLCAYIVAGVDNKHIAMLLNVLPESLKKSRTRLRKKLAISSDVDLGEYLRAFNL